MKKMNEIYMKEKQLIENEPLLQLRNTTGGNTLHIQGYGIVGNREYGYAQKFTVPPTVTDTLNNYSASCNYQSLASEAKIYHRDCLTVTEYSDGWQLDITFENDHIVLDMKKPNCESFIEWCRANNLYRDKSKVKRVIPKGDA